jgi:hypothetical protein
MLRWLLVAVLTLTAGACWSQQLAVVQLHHRSAESLVAVLRPLVAPATLAGAGAQLQVRASPSDLPRVLHLIEQSDRPPRSLVIAWSDVPPATQAAQGDAEAPPRAGSVTLSTGRAMAPGPMQSDLHGSQVLATRLSRRPAAVREGELLRVSMPASQSLWFGVHANGGVHAVPKATAAGSNGAVSAAPDVAGVAHFDAVADFAARIWIADATVAIELRTLAGGTIDAGTDQGSDHATVYGRVGQWIALADSGVDLQTTPSGQARTGLWIKVDAAPDAVESR